MKVIQNQIFDAERARAISEWQPRYFCKGLLL